MFAHQRILPSSAQFQLQLGCDGLYPQFPPPYPLHTTPPLVLDVPNIVDNCLSISKLITSPVFQRTSPRVCSSAAPASSAPSLPSSWPSPSPPSLPCNVEIKTHLNIHYISYLQVSAPTARIPALVTNSLPNILKYSRTF